MKIQCPRCTAELQIQPPQPVTDIVLEWSENAFTDERPTIASIAADGMLVLGLTTTDKRKVFCQFR